MNRRLLLACCTAGALLALAGGAWAYDRHGRELPVDLNAILGQDEDAKTPIPATPQEVAGQPADATALGNLDVLIADRGNNRVIEVSPQKRIIWEYDFRGLPRGGFGADDSFYTDGGSGLIVNLERYHLIEQIDYKTKQVLWQYGTAGVPGHGANQLNTPDDAYKLPNGDVRVADIKNCRIIEISPDKRIVFQLGQTRVCSRKQGYLDAPNGDTPLPNGDMLVSTIIDHKVTEYDPQGNAVFSLVLPLKYPSDPQLMKNGDILVAEYQDPGKVIEVNRQGNVVWEYDGQDGVPLNDPSLAIELPNGNILVNDDLNHRVIVIDKQTKRIGWQYGVTGKPGDGSAQLNIPDGVDVIPASVHPATAVQAAQPSMVGAVTRHAAKFVGAQVTVSGYVLAREPGYVLVSDEPTGAVGRYDLPVAGSGLDTLVSGKKYLFTGTFLDHGLAATNQNPDHLELSALPE